MLAIVFQGVGISNKGKLYVKINLMNGSKCVISKKIWSLKRKKHIDFSQEVLFKIPSLAVITDYSIRIELKKGTQLGKSSKLHFSECVDLLFTLCVFRLK